MGGSGPHKETRNEGGYATCYRGNIKGDNAGVFSITPGTDKGEALVQGFIWYEDQTARRRERRAFSIDELGKLQKKTQTRAKGVPKAGGKGGK